MVKGLEEVSMGLLLQKNGMKRKGEFRVTLKRVK